MLLTSPDPAADPYYARILLDMQRDAYSLEAQLVGTGHLPPLQETLVGIAAWRGQWLVAWDGVRLLGAVAWDDKSDRLEIDRLMVAPSEHRRGVGSALLQHVIATAGPRPVHAATGRDNPPAIRIYEKNGFRARGDERVLSGIWITRLVFRAV